jgi:hypothetical protein
MTASDLRHSPTSLPHDAELPPALTASFASHARPAAPPGVAAPAAHGYGSDSELERRLVTPAGDGEPR